MIFPFGKFSASSRKVYLLLVGISTSLTLSISDEIKDNTVSVLFNDTIASWKNGSRMAKFKGIMPLFANSYCPTNLDKCALKFWNVTRMFHNTFVVITAGFPQQQGNKVELHFYMKLPAGNDIRKDVKTVLPKETLEEILTNNSTEISATVGVRITLAGGNSGRDPGSSIDDTLNYIMIPVSFGLLLFVCILACCLHICQKRKMNAITEQKKMHIPMQDKPSNSRTRSPQPPTVEYVSEVSIEPRTSRGRNIEDKIIGQPQSHLEQVVTSEQGNPALQTRRKEKNKKRRTDKYDDDDDGSYRNRGYIDNDSSWVPDGHASTEGHSTMSPQGGEGLHGSRHHKKKKRRHTKRDHPQAGDCEGSKDCIEPPKSPPSDFLPSTLPPLRKLPPLRSENNNEEEGY